MVLVGHDLHSSLPECNRDGLQLYMHSVAAEQDRDWGGLRRYSRLLTAAQRPWGWVQEGVQSEGSSENHECTRFRIHLPAGTTAITTTL